MSEHDRREHDSREHHNAAERGDEIWAGRRHRHRGGGPRFRSRPGGPGFGRGDDFRGPMFGGPGFGRHFGDEADFGPFPPMPGMPPGPPFGPWSRGHSRRGSRARRGDVRAAALALLTEGPLNGYQIIQQISERSGGLWRPSPGSVYPALAQLEDEGLIAQQADAGERRAYALTDEGRAWTAEHADELRAPWSAMSGGAASAAADLRSLVRQVHVAAFGVLSAGTDEQLAQARKILAQTRRSLYRLLAEDDQDEAGDAPAAQEAGD